MDQRSKKGRLSDALFVSPFKKKKKKDRQLGRAVEDTVEAFTIIPALLSLTQQIR